MINHNKIDENERIDEGNGQATVGYGLNPVNFASEPIFSYGKSIERARKAARRYNYNEVLNDAGYSKDDIIQGYCLTLLRRQGSYDPRKGNRDQFNAGILRNFLKEILREKAKRQEIFTTSSLDEILDSVEGRTSNDSEDARTSTDSRSFVSSETKEQVADYLKFNEITHLKGLSCIEARSDVALARKIFGSDSLAFKVFAYRYFASSDIKRTDLAKAFNTTVEAVRWAERKLERAAPRFGVHRLTERERECLHRRSAASGGRYPKDSRKKLTLTTKYRR